MTRFLFLPPIDAQQRDFATRLRADLPDLQVEIVENTEQLSSALPGASAAYGWVPPEQLEHAQDLRWLQNPFAGPFVGYYYPELIEHPLTICNPRGIYSDHIAHHILMFMFALSRGLPYWIEAQRRQTWERNARKRGYIDIASSTVLIVGCGGIGRETARLCTELGADVIGIEPRLEDDIAAKVYPPSELDTQLLQADFVVTTVPHTPETEFMWNRQRFALMKPSAYFINIGRGMTTKLDDLVAALKDGEIAGAGLDVFETEPLPDGHELWSLENVLITPHVAVADAANVSERRYQLLLDNARRFLAGESLRNVVDKAKWY